MQGSPRGTLLWLFTEHRNATFTINFSLPCKAAGAQREVQYESWSGEEVNQQGVVQMISTLRMRASAALPDAAIFSRFVTPHGKTLIDLCKSLGILTIFHIDDLLQEMPTDIGEKYTSVYSSAYMAELQKCISATDGIITSTAVLAKHLAKLYPQHEIRTIKGVCYAPTSAWSTQGLRSRVARANRKLSTLGIQTIGYMGSSSHLRDLATVTPQIADLLRTRPKLHFETLGLPAPDTLKAEFGNRVREFGYSRSYPDFLHTLYELDWDLGLAPLVKDDFNQAKTATKFVEYTAAGIPTLAENIDPYASVDPHKKAIALANNEHWVEVATNLLSKPYLRQQQLRHAQVLCQSSFDGTSALNQLLLTLSQLAQTCKK
jgi:hypothetical protein